MTDGPEPVGSPVSAPASQDPAAPTFTPAQTLYLWIVAVATTSLLIADLVGVKVFELPLPFPIPGLGPKLIHTCGMITFPITFILTDLVTEYWGRAATRRMTLVAFSMAVFAFIVMSISIAMPRLDADWNVTQSAFDAVFGNARLMYIASLCAYLVGQLIDVWTFTLFKKATGGRMLWLRATGSTVISQVFDSLVVSFLYLQAKGLSAGKAVPIGEVVTFAATGYGLKFLLAVAVTPLIYAGHTVIEERFGLRPLPADEKT